MSLFKIFHSFSWQKRVLLLIAIFSIIRLCVVFTLELGTDESYYRLYGQLLQWNYFDHPPMVAIWVRAFTVNLLLEKFEGFIRLGSVTGCALSTWLMYKLVSQLSTEKAGWFAACLYNASFYTGITAGIFIMPDAPQMIFWTLSLWMIIKITIDDRKWLYWILLGAAAGLCIMSKIHGIFIWFGLGLYTIFFQREWLKNPRFYVAAMITLLFISPIFIWNINYDFVTYRFHSERVEFDPLSPKWFGIIREFVGQLVLNNPINAILIFIALIKYKELKKSMQALTIFNCIGLPFILVLLAISLYRDTLPHWSGPAYVALLPLAAINLAKINQSAAMAALHRWSPALFIISLITFILIIHYYPGTLGNTSHQDLGKGDIAVDNYGWREAGNKFAAIYKEDIRKGKVLEGTPVVCNKWWGAHEEYYFCRPIDIQMIGLGIMNNLHHYMWMNKLRKAKVNFKNAYCIVPSIDHYDVHKAYADYYSTIDSVTVIEVIRSGKPSNNFKIYRLGGWKNNLPEANKR